MKNNEITFEAKIVATVKNTPEIRKGGVSIGSVIAKLARGEMDVKLVRFINEPTIILTEK